MNKPVYSGFWTKNGQPSENLKLVFFLYYLYYYPMIGKYEGYEDMKTTSMDIAKHLCHMNPKVWCQKPTDQMATAIQQQLAFGLSKQKNIPVSRVRIFSINQQVAREMKKMSEYLPNVWKFTHIKK